MLSIYIFLFFLNIICRLFIGVLYVGSTDWNLPLESKETFRNTTTNSLTEEKYLYWIPRQKLEGWLIFFPVNSSLLLFAKEIIFDILTVKKDLIVSLGMIWKAHKQHFVYFSSLLWNKIFWKSLNPVNSHSQKTPS